MIDSALFLANRNRRRRGQRRRAIWARPWIGRRREFGIYDQLMMELRNEDPASFTNFLPMPLDMYDELLDRVGQRITKMHTRYRESLEPGLKLSLTVRHLCIWGQVYNAIIDEYKNEVLAVPNTPEGCHTISNKMESFWPSSACHLDPWMRLNLEKPTQCLHLPTQLPTRKYLSLKEGNVGLHHQKSGDYGVVRLRNGEMTMESRVGVHLVRMKFAWVSPFLHCSLVSLVA